jgi:hypothetical protein
MPVEAPSHGINPRKGCFNTKVNRQNYNFTTGEKIIRAVPLAALCYFAVGCRGKVCALAIWGYPGVILELVQKVFQYLFILASICCLNGISTPSSYFV